MTVKTNDVLLGPIHTGWGVPCNTHMQIMEHTALNGSVHTGCKHHQRVCTQICAQIRLRVLCESGPNEPTLHFTSNSLTARHYERVDLYQCRSRMQGGHCFRTCELSVVPWALGFQV